MQTLEDAVIKLLHSNGKLWFRDPLSEDDVRGLFASPLKPLKGGNQLSLRVNVPTSVTRANACTVFDESEKPVHLSYLTPEHQIISIIEVLGVRFTSSSFQLDLSCKQIAAVSNQPLFQSCVIKKDASIYSYASATSATATATATTTTAIPGVKKEDTGELKPLLETDIIINGSEQESPINIHDPLKIYYSLYKAALKRAKDAKRMSIQAFLDAKNIKNKYNLDIYDEDYNDNDSDDEEDGNNDNDNDGEVECDINNGGSSSDSNHKDSDSDDLDDSDDSDSNHSSETSETSGKPPIKIIGNENISISIEEVLT
jgi:hypothetical protein